MAILKPFKTPHGVTATYHKVLKAELDCIMGTLMIVTAVYASPEARAAGGTALWHEYTTVPFGALTQDPRSVLYPILGEFGPGYLKDGSQDEAVQVLEPIKLREEAKVIPVSPAPELALPPPPAPPLPPAPPAPPGGKG